MGTSGRVESEGAVLAQSAGSLEQVREILFGSQHRDFARRMARMDASIAAQAEDLRSEMRRRLDALEQHANKEIEALTATIEAQRSAHVEALANVARQERESAGLLEQRVKKLEELTARSQRDFRQQLLDQAKSFIDEVHRMRDELFALVDRELGAAAGEGEPAPGTEETSRREPWERPSEAA